MNIIKADFIKMPVRALVLLEYLESCSQRTPFQEVHNMQLSNAYTLLMQLSMQSKFTLISVLGA